jgi:hypothetical protein
MVEREHALVIEFAELVGIDAKVVPSVEDRT